MIVYWKIIPGYEGAYEASSEGAIRERLTHRIIPPYPAISGSRTSYSLVRLRHPDGSISGVSVHRKVLSAFRGPCPDGMIACHLNGLADDNRIENIIWATEKTNGEHAQFHNRYGRVCFNPNDGDGWEPNYCV